MFRQERRLARAHDGRGHVGALERLGRFGHCRGWLAPLLRLVPAKDGCAPAEPRGQDHGPGQRDDLDGRGYQSCRSRQRGVRTHNSARPESKRYGMVQAAPSSMSSPGSRRPAQPAADGNSRRTARPAWPAAGPDPRCPRAVPGFPRRRPPDHEESRASPLEDGNTKEPATRVAKASPTPPRSRACMSAKARPGATMSVPRGARIRPGRASTVVHRLSVSGDRLVAGAVSWLPSRVCPGCS